MNEKAQAQIVRDYDSGTYYTEWFTGGPLVVEYVPDGGVVIKFGDSSQTDPMRGHDIDPMIGICRNCARSIEDIIEYDLDCDGGQPVVEVLDYLRLTREVVGG